MNTFEEDRIVKPYVLYGHEFDSHSNWIGAYYALPGGWTWDCIPAARKAWDIPANYAPLANVRGVCIAWGILLPSNYHRIAI